MKRNNKKGFTLAELLIVVAIIAVLVAVAIPVFTTQLEKSRDAVTESNVRSAYAEASSAYLLQEAPAGSKVTYTPASGTTPASVTVSGIIVKGQSGDGSKFGADLPFKLGTGVAALLDAAADTAASTTGISLTFTWATDGTVTANTVAS